MSKQIASGIIIVAVGVITATGLSMLPVPLTQVARFCMIAGATLVGISVIIGEKTMRALTISATFAVIGAGGAICYAVTTIP